MRWRQFSATPAINRTDAARGNSEALPMPALRWAVKDVAAACNRFYRPQLDAELGLLAQRGYASEAWIADACAVVSGFEEQIKRNTAFLLRVGRHSGAEAVTLNGVRSIKIMRGKGEQPDYLKAPKTIWLAATSQEASGGLLPFGWVIVELSPPGQTPAPLPGAVSAIAKYSDAAREWTQAQAERHEALRAEREKDEAAQRERQAQAEREQQRAEAAAREECERLERMTPLERELHDLAKQHSSDKDYTVWLRHLENGRWEGEQAKEVAKHCKQAMQEQKTWREESQKKRPEKDKPYQATCRVKQFL